MADFVPGKVRVQRASDLRGKSSRGLLDLIERLPAGIVMAEVGCYAGESTALFLSSGKVAELHAIDPWQPGYDTGDGSSDSDMRLVEAAFDTRVAGYNVVKHKSGIDEATPSLPMLDFVYIDGNHTYGSVCSDIAAALQRLKPGGYIAGHDYDRRQVKQAVTELLGTPDEIFQDSSWLFNRGA